MKYLMALLFLTSCSHPIIVENCRPADSDYSICDTLNAVGK